MQSFCKVFAKSHAWSHEMRKCSKINAFAGRGMGSSPTAGIAKNPLFSRDFLLFQAIFPLFTMKTKSA